jgi:hypothetical protein
VTGVFAGDRAAARNVPDDIRREQLEHRLDRPARVHLALAAMELGDQRQVLLFDPGQPGEDIGPRWPAEVPL